MEGKDLNEFIKISPQTAEICKKLIQTLKDSQIVNMLKKPYINKLEIAEKELNGEYKEVDGIKQLLEQMRNEHK